VDRKDRPTFRVDVSGNVIQGQQCLMWMEGSEKRSPEAWRDFLTSHGTWKCREGVNLMGPRGPFLKIGDEAVPVQRLVFPRDWMAFWKVGSAPGIEGEPRFQGGDLLSLDEDGRAGLTAAAFRLTVHSPGKEKGEGGKDFGADVDKVGPGAPYERWRESPEYQEWRKEMEKLMKAP
jgi:hypothetical protein